MVNSRETQFLAFHDLSIALETKKQDYGGETSLILTCRYNRRIRDS